MSRKNKSVETAMVVTNGEAFEFRCVDMGMDGLKIELFDSRELDLLDRDILHAVLLSAKDTRNLLDFILHKSTRKL